MSIIRVPAAADPIDVDEQTFVEVEMHIDEAFHLPASYWPPGHMLCNPFWCSRDRYHYHHNLSHPPGLAGSIPYWRYLIDQDPDRLLPVEPESIQVDLARLDSMDRTRILAFRRSFRNYRLGRGPSTIPYPDPRFHHGWDDPLDEDIENTPPLQDWNFDYQSGLYYP